MGSDSESAIRALELDQLITDFFEAQRSGSAPSPDDFIAEHPQHELALRAVLPGASLLDQLGKRAEDAAEPVGRSGDKIGEFKLLGILGRGGMGVVYEAVQETLGRPVALKVLPASRVVDRKSRERFMREAQAAASLQHPGIVPVYGVGEADGQVYYAMQRIDGVPLDVLTAAARGESPDSDSTVTVHRAGLLAARMRTSVLGGSPRADPTLERGSRKDTSSSTENTATTSSRPWIRNAVKIALLATEAVSYAHSRGVLHRDIKPSNVMLDEAGRVYLTDFGLCKTSENSSLTAAGDVVGTLRYVPPERFGGRDDARGDVYGIGMILYELLCGQPAYPHKDRPELVQAVTLQSPMRPRKIDSEIPSDLEGIVLKSIAKLPEERYASAEALIADLSAFLDGRPIRARAPGKLYLAKLFVRRNRGLVTVAALALFAITVASAFYVVSLRRLVRQLDEANETTLRAVHHAELTGAANLISTEREFLAQTHLQDVPPSARDWVWHNLVSRARGPSLVAGEGESRVLRAALDAEQRQLVALRAEHVTVYDLASGAIEQRVPVSDASHAALLPGTRALVVVEGEDRRPRVVVPEDLEDDARVAAHAAALGALDLSGIDALDAEGRFLALSTVDGRVVVLDGDAPDAPRRFEGPVGKDARLALFGGEGAVVRVLPGRRSRIFGPHEGRSRGFEGTVQQAPRSVDGALDAPVFFVLTSRAQVLRFEDVGGVGPVASERSVKVRGGTHILAAGPSGLDFLSCTPRGLARLWTADRGTTRLSARAMPSYTTFLAMPRDSEDFVSAGHAGEWRRVRLPAFGPGVPGVSRERVTFRGSAAIGFDRDARHYAAVDTTGAWSVWSETRRLPRFASAGPPEVIKDVALEGDETGPFALAMVGSRVRVWRRSEAAAVPEFESFELGDDARADRAVKCGFFGAEPGERLAVLVRRGEILELNHGADGAGGPWSPRTRATLDAEIASASFEGTTGVLYAGLSDGRLVRVDLAEDVIEPTELYRFSSSVVAVDVDRHGTGDLLAVVTADRYLHLVDLSKEAPTIEWSDLCASAGQDLQRILSVGIDEASGWIVMGTPEGRLRSWSMHRGRPGPTLLDVYSQSVDIEFPRPAEPPVVFEANGRVSHLELDSINRSLGGVGAVPTEAEARALDELSPAGRVRALEAALERDDLTAEALGALRDTMLGVRVYCYRYPHFHPGRPLDKLLDEIEARIEQLGVKSDI